MTRTMDPFVVGLLQAAILTASTDNLLHACEHVDAGHHGVLCAQHPHAGLLCGDCYDRHHAPRHDATVERTCDRCSEVVDLIHPLVGAVPVTARVTKTSGSTALYIGPIHILGIGFCPPCATALSLPDPSQAP